MAQESAGPETTLPAEAKQTTSDTDVTTDTERDELASKLVDRFSIWSGAAGLIPVPLVDIAAVSGVQIQMLRRLSDMYDVPFSENRGKSIIASLAGSIVPASTTATTVGLVSALKSFPGIGTAVAALTMPALSACATWVIGKVFIQHFASGGTLLDFNPPDYREFIKAQKQKFASRQQTASGASQRGKRAPTNKEGQAANA
jgi:uncharacterized protein (DUF697 family)